MDCISKLNQLSASQFASHKINVSNYQESTLSRLLEGVQEMILLINVHKANYFLINRRKKKRLEIKKELLKQRHLLIVLLKENLRSLSKSISSHIPVSSNL